MGSLGSVGDGVELKGVLYSIITLALIAPVVMLALFYAQYSAVESRFLVAGVVGEELANYAESIDADFPRALYVSSYAAVVACVNHAVSGSEVDDAAARIGELAVNGSFDGVPSEIMGGSQTNNTLSAWVERLEEKGGAYGLAVDANLDYYNATPLNHRYLLVNANISVNASSPGYGIGFVRVYSAQAVVDLEGLEDPLLPLRTMGAAQRAMHFNTTNVWGVAAFDDAAQNGWYWPSAEGASFLDRLEGRDYTSERYAAQSDQVIGIQSIVDVGYLVGQELPADLNKSVVDNLYFNNTAPSAWSVAGSGLWWAWLDTETAQALGVELEN